MALSDVNDRRSENGGYGSFIPAYVAVGCSDDESRYTAEAVERRLPASRLVGEYLPWGTAGCAGWPAPRAAGHPDVHAPGPFRSW